MGNEFTPRPLGGVQRFSGKGFLGKSEILIEGDKQLESGGDPRWGKKLFSKKTMELCLQVIENGGENSNGSFLGSKKFSGSAKKGHVISREGAE